MMRLLVHFVQLSKKTKEKNSKKNDGNEPSDTSTNERAS